MNYVIITSLKGVVLVGLLLAVSLVASMRMVRTDTTKLEKDVKQTSDDVKKVSDEIYSVKQSVEVVKKQIEVKDSLIEVYEKELKISREGIVEQYAEYFPGGVK